MTGAAFLSFVLGASITAPGPGTPITDPDFDPPVTGATHPVRAPMQKVLFLNFDGGQLHFCGPDVDDPVDDCSSLFQGVVLPYSGDAANRAAVVQSVRQDVAPFDILVTAERPADNVDYDMEMIGNWHMASGGGFLGIAPKIDCFDADGGDVSFTLDQSPFAQDIAKVILQELAHTWGLEHVDAPADLLYPTVGGAGDPIFEDSCSPIVRLGAAALPPTPARCPEQHAAHCDEPDHQNSYADLMALFGPAQPDTEPPQLAILSPADGAITPHDFHLVFEIVDTIAPHTYATTIEIVDLYESDVPLAGPGVFPIALSDVPDGHYTIRVTVTDEAGNPASAEIAIDVGTPQNDDDTGDGTTAAPEPMPASDDGSGETTTAMITDADSGCGCRSRPAARTWLGALVLLAFARRRSRW